MSKKEILTAINHLMKGASDKKAENVCCYDLTEKNWITEYVIIIGAKNNIHCKALLEEIHKRSKTLTNKNKNEDFYEHPKESGKVESGWVILDLNSVICHFITQECREHYGIDHIFKEKTNIILH